MFGWASLTHLLFDIYEITLFGRASLKASTIMLIMPSGGVLLLAICCKAGRCALILVSSACNADMVLLWIIVASTSADTLVSMAAFAIPSFENVRWSFLLRLITLPIFF